MVGTHASTHTRLFVHHHIAALSTYLQKLLSRRVEGLKFSPKPVQEQQAFAGGCCMQQALGRSAQACNCMQTKHAASSLRSQQPASIETRQQLQAACTRAHTHACIHPYTWCLQEACSICMHALCPACVVFTHACMPKLRSHVQAACLCADQRMRAGGVRARAWQC